MKIDDKTQALIEESVLCWLATVDADFHPSVSPKELWTTRGDNELLIADIASANSVKNIQIHPKVCVSFVEIFKQKGMKFYGRACVIPRTEPEFAHLGQSLLELAGERFTIRNLICVSIERFSPIVAPSYMLFPDMEEQRMIDDAHQLYGVQPVS